jgi:hypothetical protein
MIAKACPLQSFLPKNSGLMENIQSVFPEEVLLVTYFDLLKGLLEYPDLLFPCCDLGEICWDFGLGSVAGVDGPGWRLVLAPWFPFFLLHNKTITTRPNIHLHSPHKSTPHNFVSPQIEVAHYMPGVNTQIFRRSVGK